MDEDQFRKERKRREEDGHFGLMVKGMRMTAEDLDADVFEHSPKRVLRPLPHSVITSSMRSNGLSGFHVKQTISYSMVLQTPVDALRSPLVLLGSRPLC